MAFLQSNRSLLITLAIVLLLVMFLVQGMSIPTLVSVLLSGLTLAALYFLVASGLTLIFGLMDVLNFAQGSLFMLGAYAGWVLYANPRLLLNLAPLLLLFGAGAFVGALAARRFALPRIGLWIAAGAAVVLTLFAVRDFPLAKLVAFGSSVTAQIISTPEAQDPFQTMLVRLALMFLAGCAVGLVVANRGDAARPFPASRVIVAAVGLAGVGLALFFFREPLEQFILELDSTLRFLLAVVTGAAAGGLLGALLESSLIRPLYARPIYQILLTLGLVFVFDQLIRLVWGPIGSVMQVPSFFSSSSSECPAPDLIAWLTLHCDSIQIFGRPFPSYRLFIILIGALMAVAIILIMQRTRLGMIIRAGVQDSPMVEALGINVRRVFTLVFALGAGLAGLGGVVAAPFLGVYPGMAQEFLLQAFIVVVIGGLGSIPGAVLGALLVGLARAFGDHLVLSGIQLPGMADAISGSPAIARASTVLIMAIVLLVKPTGIFGKKE